MELYRSYLSLSFIDINKLPYCVLWNKIFMDNIIMPIKLRYNFENNHCELKEAGSDKFKQRCDKFFKSQNLKTCFNFLSN